MQESCILTKVEGSEECGLPLIQRNLHGLEQSWSISSRSNVG